MKAFNLALVGITLTCNATATNLCLDFARAISSRPTSDIPVLIFADFASESDDLSLQKSSQMIRILMALDEFRREPEKRSREIRDLIIRRNALLLNDPTFKRKDGLWGFLRGTEKKARQMSESEAITILQNNFLIEVPVPDTGTNPFHAPPLVFKPTGDESFPLAPVGIATTTQTPESRVVKENNFVLLPTSSEVYDLRTFNTTRPRFVGATRPISSHVQTWVEFLEKRGPLVEKRGKWIADHPVTQLQFALVMGYNPSIHKNNGFIRIGLDQVDPNRPVENVSQDEMARFIERLNVLNLHEWQVRQTKWKLENPSKKLSEFPERYWTYRIPTPREWDFAALLGRDYDLIPTPDTIRKYGWVQDGSGRYGTQSVGKLKANPWGLYDLLGNVHERTAPDSTLQGGAWNTSPESIAYAHWILNSDSNLNVGFRLIRELKPAN